MTIKEFNTLAEQGKIRQIERLEKQKADIERKLNTCNTMIKLGYAKPYDTDELYGEWQQIHNQIMDLTQTEEEI